MGAIAALATLLLKASAFDRKEEGRRYKNSTAYQIEMANFSGNFERQAEWLLDHVCKTCGVRGIARLELIWCKDCAKKENTKDG